MTRASAIANLVTGLQSVSGFTETDTGQVSAYDEGILNNGVDVGIVVLADTGDGFEPDFSDNATWTWHLMLEIFTRHNTTIADARERADTYVQAVLDYLIAHPTLDKTVYDCSPEASEVVDERIELRGNFWLFETLRVRVTEQY